MPVEPARYLIWSHEQGRWWGKAMHGYTMSLEAAGRYTQQQAIEICAQPLAHAAARSGLLLDLPVREADLMSIFNAGESWVNRRRG